MDEKKLLQQLKIKTGACTRLTKEVRAYEQEVTKGTNSIETMRAEGKDPADIAKQEEVLQESVMMVPDAKNRLDKAKQALQAHLALIRDSEHKGPIEETDEWKAAVATLE
eukprot:TRINITY_DN874_c0_g1_i1.p1 TRINITY_DN874_c0_g1~~TRINITY_DN874_c0_g1_i1.p1  ORF type:complete len:110 (-),score=28.89 TRINITY_DN874_c0_g1_i1:112-441(-)